MVLVVDSGAAIVTDEFASYQGIGKQLDGGHHTVNHGAKMVVHTKVLFSVEPP